MEESQKINQSNQDGSSLESETGFHISEIPLESLGVDDDSHQDDVFEMLGAIGDGSGVGFIPNNVTVSPVASFYNFSGTPITASAFTGIGGVATVTQNALNNFVAYSFRAHNTYVVNRVAFHVASTSLPVGITITGGITNLDMTTGNPQASGGPLTFIGSGTTTALPLENYSVITMSDTTLTAGSYYTVAFQVTARTSGTYLMTRNMSARYFSNTGYPTHIQRQAGQGQAKVNNTGASVLLWGYNDGSATTWYNYPFDGTDATTLQLNRVTAPVYAEVGAKISFNYPIQEFLIRGVSVNFIKNNNHSLICKVYGSDGTTQIGSDVLIGTSMYVFAYPNISNRLFMFKSPLRILPYTNYYFMFNAGGIATDTNTTVLVGWLPELAGTLNNGMSNTAVTRAVAGSTIVEDTTIIPELYFLIDYTYLGNRVGGNAFA